MNLKSVKIIAVDFDGTLCENNWPGIGAPLLRETMTIMVNGTPTKVYKDEIEKQIYSQLYSGLGLKLGS